MLRLPGALQEPWLGYVCELRHSVVVGRVQFSELSIVVADLLSVWECVRTFVRSIGPEHVQSSSNRVSFFFLGGAGGFSSGVGLWHFVFL